MITEIKEAIKKKIEEIDKAIEDMHSTHEGLRDYARLNIQDDTRREVEDAIEDYDRREQLLQQERLNLVSLLGTVATDDQILTNDGYPNLPQRQISAAAVADLQEQLDTITAARSLFAQQATTFGMSAGPKEPK